MKCGAVWIRNLLANMTRHLEKQKPWAKKAACGASCVSRHVLLHVITTRGMGQGG